MNKRATQPAAKARRRGDILHAAAQLFETIGYDNISMALVAERAGLAKGTPYRYFPTREAIFLALYAAGLDAWMNDLHEQLPDVLADDSANDPANKNLRFAGLVADLLDRHPRLPALAAILHSVLERNIDADTAMIFRRQMLRRLSRTGELLESRFGFLSAGDGARLLLRLHALVIGLWHASMPAPVVRKLLESEEFSPFRIDFSEEFENVFYLLLEGWRQQSS